MPIFFVAPTPLLRHRRGPPRRPRTSHFVACSPVDGPASTGSSSQLSQPVVSPRSSLQQQSHLGPPSSAQPALDGQPANEAPGTQYVPLHVHSDFSLLDGASQLPDLVARAAELGVPALALTDHGVLYGAISLVRECAKAPNPVKPIIGNEMYVVNVETPYTPPDPEDSDAEAEVSIAAGRELEAGAKVSGAPKAKKAKGKKKKKPAPRRYHLIVLAKNTTGYRNLVKLTTHAHLEGKIGTGIFARPSVNKALLYEHREGLIVSSGCLGGEVAQAILNNRCDVARDVARWFRDAFGDDYYLEIQDHGSHEDRIVNREIVEIGRELGIPVICTNDSHFTSCLDAEAHDALICIQTGKVLDDRKRLHYAGNEYFKSVDEMRQCFVDHLEAEDIEAALARTLEVAAKVEAYDLFGDTRIPDFPVPPPPLLENMDGARIDSGDSVPPYLPDDHASYLRYVAREGMDTRLNARLASGLLAAGDRSVSEVRNEYLERLEFELDMIEKMGFASYHLVVWDYIRYAREEGIPVGPGRGSAAGSLVAFALRITDVDPIQYNLLFERFLNPERKSMPDIDTDFSVDGREKLIRYVTEKYGWERVAQIITFNRLTSKSVLKDVARVHQVPYSQADKLAKLIPVARGKPAKLSAMLSKDGPSAEFRQIVAQNKSYSRWLEKARRIEGTNKTFGIHAAGVVISAQPLSETVPLSRAKHGETITQYPMEDVEAMGLLKMDFLGLKNLTVIESTLKFINARRRQMRELPGSGSAAEICGDMDFSVDALPLDDAKTYELLATGELDGIFQLDASAGMRNIVRELRPSSLEDLSAILALYRPGPLDAGLVPKFINRKHGREPISYDHEMLAPILKDTYGIMVYQEQIMRIARDLAGYSLGQADILRRSMGKKKKEIMEQEKPRFVQGAVGRGVDSQTATKLFEMMEKFAEYCFNKSHSTAYAYLTYQTAYLKANYPVEYTAALLRANSNQADKLVRYLADASRSGVRVLPPCVNRSELGFSVDSVASSDGEDNGSTPSGGSKTELAVLFGLEAIKTVGESVGRALINEREAGGPFRSIIDVIERLDSRVLNKRSMGALVACGAFDELHANRKILGEQLETLLALHRRVRDRKKRRAKKEMTIEAAEKAKLQDVADWEAVQLNLQQESESQPDYPMLEKLAAEKATLGFYASGHPLRELDGDVTSMFSTICISDIVGESSHAEDSAAVGEQGSSSGGETSAVVSDGTEVMCLSLVTDLKRMITAKGKKMAKWFMEDTSGRVSAVIFPNAYPVCDAVVSGANTVDDSEPERVVEDDARVVVWGKVDRESSGTVQVIVDDVQRVEDVTVLLATLPCEAHQDASRHRPIRERSAFVTHLARRLQDPESLQSAALEGQEYSFTNSQGQEVRARRRPRKTNLATKARIPLIVKEVGVQGETLSCFYGGHACRFQEVTKRELDKLSSESACSFSVVRIADILECEENFSSLKLFGVEDSEGSSSSASDTFVPPTATAEDDATTVGTAHGSFALEAVPHGATQREPVSVSDRKDMPRGELPPQIGEALREDLLVGTRTHELGAEEVEDGLYGTVSRRDMSKGRTGSDSDLASQNADAASSLARSFGEAASLLVREPVLADSQSVLTPAVQMLKARRSKKQGTVVSRMGVDVGPFSDLAAPPDPAVDGKVPSSSLSPQHANSSMKTGYTGESAGTTDRSISNQSDPPCSEIYATDVLHRLARSLSHDQRNMLRSLKGEPEVENRLIETVFGGDGEEIRVQSSEKSSSSYRVEREDDIAFEAPPVDVSAVRSESMQLSEEAESENGQGSTAVQSAPLGPAKGTKGADSTAADPWPLSDSALHVAAGETELAADLADRPVLSKIGRKRTRVSLTGVVLTSPRLGCLLDAMCHVAGAAVETFAQTQCNVISLDSLEVSDIGSLSGTVDVSGSVAVVDGSRVNVLVRVRESVATGKRKRVRMLASSVVSLDVDCSAENGLTAPAFVPISIQEKKDASVVVQRLHCFSPQTAESDAFLRESSFSVDVPPETVETLFDWNCVKDGGNILLWMSRAAEYLLREMYASSDAGVWEVFAASSFRFREIPRKEMFASPPKVKCQISQERAGKHSIFVDFTVCNENQAGVSLADVFFIAHQQTRPGP